MTRLRRNLTYANVMATLAFFLAVGGGAYAINKAAKNSVVTKSIKNGAVTTSKIRQSAVDDSKVLDGSLLAADINIPSLGLLKTSQIVLRQNSKTVPSMPIDNGSSIGIDCQAGERAIGGGADTSDPTAAVSESWPTTTGGAPTGWFVAYFNGGTFNLTNVQITAYVICAPL